MNVKPFSHDPLYRGPQDGRSEAVRPWVKHAIKGLVGACVRVEVEGRENVPPDGGHIFAANHPAQSLDVYAPHMVVNQDLRTMVRVERYHSSVGAGFNHALGAFPVDRNAASDSTKEHSQEILRHDQNLLLFPEGRYSEEDGKMGKVKRGTASFALRAPARSVVPMALHYEADTRSRVAEKLIGAGLALAGGTALALVGGPLAVVVGGALAGAAVGSQLARSLGRFALRNGQVHEDPIMRRRLENDPALKAGFSLVGATAGALVGATGAALLSVAAPVAAVAGAVGATRMAWDFVGRDLLKIKVERPIPTKNYLEMDYRLANTALSEELQARIGQSVAALSGIPYDPEAPRIETRKGSPIEG